MELETLIFGGLRGFAMRKYKCKYVHQCASFGAILFSPRHDFATVQCCAHLEDLGPYYGQAATVFIHLSVCVFKYDSLWFLVWNAL